MLVHIVNGYPRKMRNMMRKNRKRNRKKYFCSETLSSRSSQSFSNTNEPNNLSLDQNLLVGVSSQLYEGQLSKYTNMMKGWQLRWFILNAKTGILSYFINESDKWKRPKGWTNLISAIISPSDEDSNTFTVSSVCGNCLKLRARDARGRRDWITKLRTVAQHHGDSTREKVFQRSSLKSEIDETKEAFDKVKKHLFETEKERLLLTKAIDDLPTRGKLHHLDPDFLTLKALSYAVVVSLNQCLFILQEQPHRSEL
nr:oxysterol-binding protein-related protein 11-like isoform X2 [Halyomorpha halys]